jgi:hypothetical protein
MHYSINAQHGAKLSMARRALLVNSQGGSIGVPTAEGKLNRGVHGMLATS